MLSFDLRCGQCLGVHCTDDLRWLCVLSLHREVGGVRQCTLFKIAVHSAEVRHTATTLAFTDLHDRSCYYFSIKNFTYFVVAILNEDHNRAVAARKEIKPV